MYRKVLNYLRGQVTVEVESAAPERVLNLCAAHGIPFWELEWLSEIRLRAVTSRAALPRLQAALAQTDAAVTVLRRQGAPEVWRQYRRRYVLWAAAGLLLAASVLGSTHIWAFQVTGNDTVPTETILRTLEKYGVTLGSRSRIDQEDLRNHALTDLPDVVWLTVNIRGCTAHVQVVERQRPPHLYTDGEKTNVVAARDGLVTKVQALDVGRKRIKIYGKGSMTGPDCDKMTVYHQARLPFGLTLPATLAVERTVRYAAAETERPEAEARAEGQEQLLRQLQVMLDAGGGQLLRHSFDAARQGKWLVVTLRAECEEQIGVSSPLSTDGAE